MVKDIGKRCIGKSASGQFINGKAKAPDVRLNTIALTLVLMLVYAFRSIITTRADICRGVRIDQFTCDTEITHLDKLAFPKIDD